MKVGRGLAELVCQHAGLGACELEGLVDAGCCMQQGPRPDQFADGRHLDRRSPQSYWS